MTDETKQIKGGLIYKKPDKRNFNFGKVFGTIDLSEIPADFIVAEPKQKDQGDTDFCSAFSSTSASEPQEGVELNPFWQFAVSKVISGDPEAWGQTLENAIKVHTKYGAINESDFDRGEFGDEELRYIKNYPEELFEKAEEHKKQSYFEAKGYKETFDSYRACLWANRTTKRLLITGVILHDSWIDSQDGIIKESGNPVSGDACIIIGQKTIDGEPYLIAQLSAGEKIGDKGKLYYSREMINKYFNFGGFLFVDMPPEEAKKKAWSVWRRIWESVKKNIRWYFEEIFK